MRGRWLLALAGLLLVSYLLAPAAVAHPTPAASAQTAPQPTATTTVPPADQSQQAQQAQQKANRCDHLSNPVARNACRAATVPADLVGGAAASVAGNIVSSAGDSALRSFTNAVATAGKWFMNKVGALLSGTTSPDVVNAGWFTSQYRVMLALAVIVALPILLVSVAQAIVRADAMQAIRSAFVYLPLAAILSFVGPAIAQMLIGASDWMSSAVSHNAASDAQRFMSDAGGWLGALGAGTVNPGVPVFGVLIASMLVVLGAISIWLELLLRSAAIYIAVLFLPLGLAAMIWPAGLRWCKRLIEFLIAIIFAKVFIVAIINLAAAGLAKGGIADKFEGVLAGGALMLMAAFTPIALLRLIPLAEAAVVTAGHQRAALRQATAGATALSSSSVVSQMINARFRNAGTAGAAMGASAWGAAAPAAAAAGGASSTLTAMRQRASSGFAAVGPNAGGPPPSGFVAAPVGGTTGGGGATRQPADRQLGGERSGGSDRGTT